MSANMDEAARDWPAPMSGMAWTVTAIGLGSLVAMSLLVERVKQTNEKDLGI